MTDIDHIGYAERTKPTIAKLGIKMRKLPPDKGFTQLHNNLSITLTEISKMEVEAKQTKLGSLKREKLAAKIKEFEDAVSLFDGYLLVHMLSN